MVAKIEIDGKKLTSIREACTEVSYSRDYVTRLAREGKIVASLIGRQWFVDTESLKNYAAQSEIESKLRKAQLSEERKLEQLFYKTKEQQQTSHQKRASSVQSRAVVASGSVLALGLVFGVFGYAVFMTPFDLTSTFDQPKSVTQSSQTAANANSVSTERDEQEVIQKRAPVFSTRKVVALEPSENGILILPNTESADPADVFSDEVEIRTATSGEQTAVLVDANGVESEREVPFVLVPVKTAQN